MSDAANRARFDARFGARFISVLVSTETERKRAPNRARFAKSDISLSNVLWLYGDKRGLEDQRNDSYAMMIDIYLILILGTEFAKMTQH